MEITKQVRQNALHFVSLRLMTIARISPRKFKECKEGQIFIEPQGFCVLAGVGIAEGLAERALKSVEERLDTNLPRQIDFRIRNGLRLFGEHRPRAYSSAA